MPTSALARLLIGSGVVLAIIGLLLLVGERYGLGRLPGDVTWRGSRTTVYLPIATSLLLSILLSLVVWLVQYWRR